MSAADFELGRKIESPCCGADVELAWKPFQHAGRPRRSDQRLAIWHYRCPACDLPQEAAIEIRLRARRPASIAYSTYGELIGPTMHFDRDGKLLR